MSQTRAGIENLRESYQNSVKSRAVFLKGETKDIPSIADKGSSLSVNLARSICASIHGDFLGSRISAQTAGNKFEECTRQFLEGAFTQLDHLRPGRWQFKSSESIAGYAQYQHLDELDSLSEQHDELRVVLGDYLIKADIVVARGPEIDEAIDSKAPLVSGSSWPRYTPLRKANSDLPILHASVSCKITLRSDRAQNVRTEGLNIVKNRKGHTPHIVLVTAEPMPSRIASAAMGTGEIDCVYHFALDELARAVEDSGDEGSADILKTMVGGNRLRDISDLPFDLAS